MRLFYFGGPHLGAIRIDDFKFQFYQQPFGWPGEKVTTDMPTIVNLRQDPFERTPAIRGETLNNLGGGYMNEFYAREFWRFVLVQQQVAALAETAIEFPPMQAPASFNLEAVKRQVNEVISSRAKANSRIGATGGRASGRACRKFFPFKKLSRTRNAIIQAAPCKTNKYASVFFWELSHARPTDEFHFCRRIAGRKLAGAFRRCARA